jgi:CubicO group peptidase (beta-lactamase class C family)
MIRIHTLILLVCCLSGGLTADYRRSVAHYRSKPSHVANSAPGRRASTIISGRSPTSCPVHPVPIPLPTGSLPSVLATAFSDVKSALANQLGGGLPGASVSAWYLGQEVTSYGLGVANKSANAPVTPSTLFRIASVSKLFPVLLLYMLEDPGYKWQTIKSKVRCCVV